MKHQLLFVCAVAAGLLAASSAAAELQVGDWAVVGAKPDESISVVNRTGRVDGGDPSMSMSILCSATARSPFFFVLHPSDTALAGLKVGERTPVTVKMDHRADQTLEFNALSEGGIVFAGKEMAVMRRMADSSSVTFNYAGKNVTFDVEGVSGVLQLMVRHCDGEESGFPRDETVRDQFNDWRYRGGMRDPIDITSAYGIGVIGPKAFHDLDGERASAVFSLMCRPLGRAEIEWGLPGKEEFDETAPVTLQIDDDPPLTLDVWFNPFSDIVTTRADALFGGVGDRLTAAKTVILRNGEITAAFDVAGGDRAIPRLRSDCAMDLPAETSDQIAKALSGDPEAMYAVGDRFYNGDGVHKDLRQSLRWYVEARNLEYAPAMYKLGLMMSDMDNNNIPQESIDLWTEAAAADHVPSAYILGLVYAERSAGHFNAAKARQYLTQASNLGESGATYKLGYLNFKGIGGRKNLSEAARLWALAADAGDADAALALGSLYQKGQGVPKDAGEARRWFERARDLGSDEAAKILSDLPASS